MVDTRNFLSIRESRVLALAGGESRELPVELEIPASTPAATRDTIIVTAKATSGTPTTNSTVVDFTVGPATTQLGQIPH